MPSVSTVPAAKTGILTLIRARAGLNGVQVEWAWPGKDAAKECVFMGQAQFSDEHVVGMRPAKHTQQEGYVVPVFVYVLSEGNDAQAAETRMWTLVGEVEQAIRADKTLNGAAGTMWGQVTKKTPGEYTNDQGWVCDCQIDISVVGRD